MFEAFQKETTDRQIGRQRARMETWLAVWSLNARQGSPDLAFTLALIAQDSGALEASRRGL